MSRCKGSGPGQAFAVSGLKLRLCHAPIPWRMRTMSPLRRSLAQAQSRDTGRADRVLRRFSWQDDGDEA